jgi:methanogenic corrinoid protein MtbC1
VATTLNIAAVARKTGVPADTLRKWEQRYGVLRPGRTTGGQRRYSDEDVARVEWLRARLDEGYRIGEAAALLGAIPLATGGSKTRLQEAISTAVRAGDVTALVGLVEETLALNPLEVALADVLAPALAAIGDAWEAGEITVAQEHLASGVVRAHLERLLADHRGAVRGSAVLACVPGERHELGLLMLAVLLRADGWQVAYLGADTPLDDAAALARDLDARVIALSATMPESLGAVRDWLEGAANGAAEIVVGGRATAGAGEVEGRLRTLKGDLRDAVRDLRGLTA